MARRGDTELHPSKKTCFVICPIGDDNSEERRWSDDVLECIITPVVEKMGYQTPIRADQINKSGIITRQIVDLLIESDLVIADLSYRNPNVCYELAIRHVVNKPFIHMIRNGHKIPFDTASNRAITVDLHIRNANKAMIELENHILSIEEGNIEMDNPIGTALTIRDLKSSGDPTLTASADIMEAIQGLSAEIRDLKKSSSNINLYPPDEGLHIISAKPNKREKGTLTSEQRELLGRYDTLCRKILNASIHHGEQKILMKYLSEYSQIKAKLQREGIDPHYYSNMQR